MKPYLVILLIASTAFCYVSERHESPPEKIAFQLNAYHVDVTADMVAPDVAFPTLPKPRCRKPLTKVVNTSLATFTRFAVRVHGGARKQIA